MHDPMKLMVCPTRKLEPSWGWSMVHAGGMLLTTWMVMVAEPVAPVLSVAEKVMVWSPRGSAVVTVAPRPMGPLWSAQVRLPGVRVLPAAGVAVPVKVMLSVGR